MRTTIADIRQCIQHEFAEYSACFEQTLHSDNAMLQQVIRYLLQQKGKQVRPTLVLLTAKLCGEVTKETIQTAVSLELLHTASILHDDVVDSTYARRGNPSVNGKWSNKIAILVGDYMLSLTLGIASKLESRAILAIIANTGDLLAKGELLQLSNTNQTDFNEANYFEIIRQKTAGLFAACTEAAAISSHASKEATLALKRFGELMGIIFQLKDDLLDFMVSEKIGKPTMNDIRDGKVTLPLMRALEYCDEKEKKGMLALVSKEQFTEAELHQIRTFVHANGGIEATEKVIDLYYREAIELLHSFEDSPVKTALILLLQYTIHREL